jgi:hypothetical protein
MTTKTEDKIAMTVIPSPESDQEKSALLRLDEGKYAGLEFRFGKVSFSEEENEDGSINMTFDFDVEKSYNETLSIEEVEKDEELHQVLGDLMIQILTEHAESKTEEEE